ncbi:MAG: cation:dicarboxylase symporter family transporter [Muribaculaceae bacterium]|nr:cation:dicarboxylase symporter family transporter [Muribaculaceae bacterium]
MRLLTYIIIAIAAGIGAGFILPEWAARLSATFNALFGSLLAFVIPLLIVGFVAPAIADTGRRAGAMLATTVAVAYAMTFASGAAAYLTADAIFPALLSGEHATAAAATAGTAPAPFFAIDIPPLMGVTAALALAFLLGFGTAALPAAAPLRAVLDDFRSIIKTVITKVIIPLLPFYIFGIFMSMTMAGTVAPVLATFAKIIAVIFVLHIVVLLAQYGVASLFSGINPLRALRTMLPAYFTALGTQSSAATIPVTLERTIAMGVDRNVAGFVVPLCATIHMSGSTLKIVACAIALMIVNGMPYSPAMFAAFIAALGVTIIAAPGVPGGAIMASLGLLASVLGFSETDCAMMIALYIAMDSFGTACNITGDGAIAQIVGRLFRKATPEAMADA